jgi:hypothetical protein
VCCSGSGAPIIDDVVLAMPRVLRFVGSRRAAVGALVLAAMLGASPWASASVRRAATPAGYSLTFRGALRGTASGGTVKGCAFDPLGLPEFAVQWVGFTVDRVPYNLYLDAKGQFKAGVPIPITNSSKGRSATLRVVAGKRVFDKPVAGSVQLSAEGSGVLDAVLGPKVKGKPLRLHGTFVCVMG